MEVIRVIENGGAFMKSGHLKSVILILVIVYVISPIDVCPGPVDDLIVLLMGLAAQKKMNVIDG